MTLPSNSTPPNEKKLRFVSFAIHAARGLVRDQNARRKTMFIVTIAALLLLFAGSTFLAPLLDSHLRPGWFIFYWLVCAWITLTAALLAVFDLLIVRALGRAEKRSLAQKISTPPEGDDAN
jgi:protein-S-isoprenylcysteine O-methyltransferase Ste14